MLNSPRTCYRFNCVLTDVLITENKYCYRKNSMKYEEILK